MKNLISYSLISFVIISFFGCTNNTTENPDFIIGKWKHSKNSKNEIEFTKTGEFIVWFNGESYVQNSDDNEKPIKYLFDPTAEKYNFRIFDDKPDYKLYQQGVLEIIDENKMEITLFQGDSILIKTELIRSS